MTRRKKKQSTWGYRGLRFVRRRNVRNVVPGNVRQAKDGTRVRIPGYDLLARSWRPAPKHEPFKPNAPVGKRRERRGQGKPR